MSTAESLASTPATPKKRRKAEPVSETITTTWTKTTTVTKTVTKTMTPAVPTASPDHIHQSPSESAHTSVLDSPISTRSSVLDSPTPGQKTATGTSGRRTRVPAPPVFTPQSRIPHPSAIQLPHPGDVPEGYYVVTSGQEVGIFYHWPHVAARVIGVSKSVYKCYDSFAEALRVYTASYEANELEVRPTPNGPFWHGTPASHSSPARNVGSTSRSPLTSERLSAASTPQSRSRKVSMGENDPIWDQVPDISDIVSQLTLDSE